MEWCSHHPSSVPAGTCFVYIYSTYAIRKGSSLPPFAVSSLQPTLKTVVCCVCAEVSSAHLLPWDRGEGEPRGASAAHLGQVLGQQIQILILFDIFLVKLKKSLTPQEARCAFICGRREYVLA
jgi:hypothetical protein